MSPELAISLGKIAGSVVLLAIVLWGVSKLSKIAKLDPEIGRKLVHISLGLYCLTFPWVFTQAWEVAATCALAIGVFFLARGAMRQQLGEGLHAVKRISYGEILFAVSVALLFWLKDGHYIMSAQERPAFGPVLYILPILILTLCDAASALVGSQYGRKKFQIEEGSKSVEGVVVFAVTAWLLCLIAFLLFTEIGRGEIILLAFITAAFGALLEAASWRGLDNLFIPLGLYFLFANLMHFGVPGLAVIAGLFFITLIGLIAATSHASGRDRHFLAISSTLFFCIAIFSGLESILTPWLAVAAYFLTTRGQPAGRPTYDALNLLLIVLAIALIYFLISNLASTDTIFSFNIAFAALTAGIVALFGSNILLAAGAAILAWSATLVRLVWMENGTREAWVCAMVGAACIIVVALVGWLLRNNMPKRLWLTMGGLSMAVGLAALPASP